MTKKAKLKPGICQFCGAPTGQPNFFRCEEHWNERAEHEEATAPQISQAPQFDIAFDRHGSDILVRGLSQAGRDWLDQNVSEAQGRNFGNFIAANPNYCGGIFFGATAAGLNVHIPANFFPNNRFISQTHTVDKELLIKTAKRLRQSEDVVRDLPCSKVVN